MDELKKIFARRLKEIRLKKGLTQEQLGTPAGIGKSAIVNIEKGDRWPSVEVLISMADTLDISIDYLLGNIDEPKPRNDR